MSVVAEGLPAWTELVAGVVKLTYHATPMKRVLFIILPALAVGLAAYLWWCHPTRVDMAAYAPHDALAYIEVNDLTSIVSGIGNMEAWRVLSPAAISPKLQRATWLSRIAYWTGIGSAEDVVLARAQFAIVVVGLDASDDQTTLLIRPSAALVIETHTSKRRMASAIERRVDQLARRVYPQSSPRQNKVEGIDVTEWVSPQDGRSIVLAFFNSEAIVANDVKAVLACIAVRRGGVQNLLSNAELQSTRAKLRQEDAVAFGYVSNAGLGNLLAAVAPIQFEGISTSTRGQQLLTGLASKLFKSAGWSLKFKNGLLEDRYFLGMPTEVSAALNEATTPTTTSAQTLYSFLPEETYSCTEYRFKDAGSAWRGLNRALSSRLDIMGAVLVNPVLRATLAPYGIDEPEPFLEAVGPEILTARLDEDDTNSVLVAQIKDEMALRKMVAQRLGPASIKQDISNYQMLVSPNSDSFAASFAGPYLLMGPSPSVRQCLLAKAGETTLATQSAFKRALQTGSSASPVTVTYSRDIQSVRALMSLLDRPPDQSNRQLEDSFKSLPYAETSTAIGSDGIERLTRSSSGLIATLAALFTSDSSPK